MNRARWARATRHSLWLPVLAVVAAGCGSSSSSSSGGGSSASTPASSTTAGASGAASNSTTSSASSSSSSSGGAAATVAKYLNDPQGLSIPTLVKKPPTGVKVAVVNCTDPTCGPNEDAIPYKALGWDSQSFIYEIAQGPAALNKALQNAIDSHPKYIALASVFPPVTFASTLKQATKAGIKVVVWANGAKSVPGTGGCIACDSEQAMTGTLAADTAIADGAKSGEIAFANDPTAGPLVDQYIAAKRRVAQLLNGSPLPLIQLSQAQAPTQNASTVANYLQRNTNIKYVLFSVSSLASGVPQALSQDGLSSRVKIITQDPQPTDLQEIASGQQYATVGAEDLTAQWRVADLLARMSIGEKVPTSLQSPAGWHEIITKQNVAKAQGKEIEPPNFEAAFKKAWHSS